MQAINTSFEVLNDPVKRKAHDEWIDRKTGRSASTSNTATRSAPQQEPFRPSPPPQQEPAHTYTPPRNPTLEWQLGCFRWIMGFLLVGTVFGVLDMCSDKPRRSRYSPPAPAATPTPTPLPPPAKPVDPIKVPFGFRWGVSVEQVKEVVAQAGAKFVADGRQQYQRVLAVEGIERPGLERTVFRFLNDSLREVEFTYGKAAWHESPSAHKQRWVAGAVDKYGEGYQLKDTDTEAAGIRKNVEGWAWVQDASSFRMVFVKHQAGEQETEHIVLTYSSAAFPPHETVTFLTAAEALAPFQVKTEAGANYLIKLVDPQTRKNVVRMYVVGGQTADVDRPIGSCNAGNPTAHGLIPLLEVGHRHLHKR
jgi:hypothetical protein